jgi:opacity protein-like surface antigen
MKRLCGSIVVGTLVALATATPALAQKPFVFFGGGVVLPMSDYKDFAKTGWGAQVGIGIDIGTKGLWADVEGMYGTNNHEVTDGETTLLSGMGVLGYSFSPAAKVSPYLLGGLGFLRVKSEVGTASTSETDFAYTGGLGLGFRLSPVMLFFVEGRYVGGDTQFIPIMAGLSITLGSNSN